MLIAKPPLLEGAFLFWTFCHFLAPFSRFRILLLILINTLLLEAFGILSVRNKSQVFKIQRL